MSKPIALLAPRDERKASASDLAHGLEFKSTAGGRTTTMRMLLVALILSTGLAACADRTYPAWLPAPISDDPAAQEIISGVEPPSPYLLKPYPPPRPWSWPTTSEQRALAKSATASFDPQRVSRKLTEGTPLVEVPPRDIVERAPLP